MSEHTNKSEIEQHQLIWQLLPWYANDTLQEPERNTAAQHIAECQLCEEEIGRCRIIAAAVRASDATTWKPSPEGMARLMARIDSKKASPQRKSRWISFREWLEKIRLAFQEAASFLRWTVAAQTAVIALLVGVILWQAVLAPSTQYRTLSDSDTRAETGTAQIQVIFAEDITEGELRTLLRQTKSAIVDGPSAMAVYTIAVVGSGSEALDILRAHPKVRLAEPKQR